MVKDRSARARSSITHAARLAAVAFAAIAATLGCDDDANTALPAGSQANALAETETLTLEAAADTLVRTDLDVRRNDNYGCEGGLMVGTGRGGGGIPWGGADAMRSYVRFAMPAISAAEVLRAELQFTVVAFNQGTGSSVFTLAAHRVIDSAPRTPWQEGNGTTNPTPPAGCVDVDQASGMAWEALDANNQSQPDFEGTPVATATATQGSTSPGDLVRWDVTSLVRAWLAGGYPNLGLVVRDPTSDGSFRELYFASRERGAPYAGPRLVLTIAPTFRCVGFEPPLGGSPLIVRGSRTLALRAKLLDSEALEVSSTTITAPPALQVLFLPAGGGAPVDVTTLAASRGLPPSGTSFAYTPDAKWQFNLATDAFTAAGEYRVFLRTGDASEYLVNPACEGAFLVR